MKFCGFKNDSNVLYDTRVQQETIWPRQDSNACSTILNDFSCILFYENGKWIFSQPHQFSTNLDSYLSTVEFNSRLGLHASWTPVEVIDYIAKWWQIKSFLVCMIFTPQCLVSRCNLVKIDPINIKSKQLYSPHFRINYMYSLVKNTKYSFRKQNRNRLRVEVLLTSCSPGRNRAKHGDSREIKTKTSFTQVGTNSATDCSTFCTSP